MRGCQIVAAVLALAAHLERVRELHQKDLAEGHGEVELPFALARKYPQVIPSFGYHPWYVKERSPDWQAALVTAQPSLIILDIGLAPSQGWEILRA